jgi:hypothetical protein
MSKSAHASLSILQARKRFYTESLNYPFMDSDSTSKSSIQVKEEKLRASEDNNANIEVKPVPAVVDAFNDTILEIPGNSGSSFPNVFSHH